MSLSPTAWTRTGDAKLAADGRRNVAMGWPDFAWTVIAADGFLALHDSAAALRAARFHVDTAMMTTPLLENILGGIASTAAALRRRSPEW